jgi:uracil-DNA glycosylase
MNAQQQFEALVAEASACVRCERMRERQAVLSHRNGALRPKVLFIAEAPGRKGGDRTRVPFHGDSSGANFEKLLASVALRREEVFITNSVLCSPRKPSGANDKPARSEIKNCSAFLQRLLVLLDPPVIATLGAVALEAIRLVEPHAFTLRDHAANVLRWQGRWLVPLYHPSPQVLITVRSLAQQQQDYRVLRRALAKGQEVRPIS